MYLDNINTSSSSKIQYLYSNYKEIRYPVLKGMFERGIARNGLSNDA